MVPLPSQDCAGPWFDVGCAVLGVYDRSIDPSRRSIAMPHGHFAWNELVTNDVEAAKRFYADTLGWSYESMPMPQGGSYWLARLGDKMVGGLMTMADVPPSWLPYIEVDDVDA